MLFYIRNFVAPSSSKWGLTGPDLTRITNLWKNLQNETLNETLCVYCWCDHLHILRAATQLFTNPGEGWGVSLSLSLSRSDSEAVQQALGPLLVEIVKSPSANLGICLTTTIYRAKQVIIIDKIKAASVAER